jgi:hypothetical protein
MWHLLCFSTETHNSRATCKNIQKQLEKNLYTNFLAVPLPPVNSPNDTYASNITYVTTHSVVFSIY